jgi:hypothetical protein
MIVIKVRIRVGFERFVKEVKKLLLLLSLVPIGFHRALKFLTNMLSFEHKVIGRMGVQPKRTVRSENLILIVDTGSVRLGREGKPGSGY